MELPEYLVVLNKLGELATLGDRLAHELMHRDHPELLEKWWKARNGKCTVCHDPEHVVPDHYSASG